MRPPLPQFPDLAATEALAVSRRGSNMTGDEGHHPDTREVANRPAPPAVTDSGRSSMAIMPMIRPPVGLTHGFVAFPVGSFQAQQDARAGRLALRLGIDLGYSQGCGRRCGSGRGRVL